MSVQKQIGELDQQPKPADGCAGRRHRKDIHAKAAAKILLVKSHARGSPATTIFNLELDRETRESAPVAAAAEFVPFGDRFLRCCRSAGPLPLLAGSGP